MGADRDVTPDRRALRHLRDIVSRGQACGVADIGFARLRIRLDLRVLNREACSRGRIGCLLRPRSER